jgi:hypothetical protein
MLRDGCHSGTCSLLDRVSLRLLILVWTASDLRMAEVKKQERDFTPEVDSLIPEATSLAKV